MSAKVCLRDSSCRVATALLCLSSTNRIHNAAPADGWKVKTRSGPHKGTQEYRATILQSPQDRCPPATLRSNHDGLVRQRLRRTDGGGTSVLLAKPATHDSRRNFVRRACAR